MIGYSLLFPEIFLLISSCIALFFKCAEKFILGSALVAILIIVFQYNDSNMNIFNNMLHISSFSQTIKIIILAFSSAFFVQLISIKQNYDKQVATLVLFSIIGMMLVISSRNLLSFYLAVELQSLPMYVLAAIDKKSVKSSEAGVKYFVLGALASALMLYGISLIFFINNTFDFSGLFTSLHNVKVIGLIFFISGLLFKIGFAPFHAWLPDVYEGSPTIITTFFAVVAKISIVAILVTFLSGYFQHDTIDVNSYYFIHIKLKNMLVWLSIISLFIGAFSAMKQTNIKRFIAFASITHIGYLGLGVASSYKLSIDNPAIFYLIIYSVINIGIFSFILLMQSYKIKNLSGFAQTNKLLALCFSVLLLSSAGIPPFTGFFTKLYVVKGLIDDNLIIPALLSLCAGILSAFYYIKIIKIIYFDDVTNDSILTLKENKIMIFLIILTALFNSLFFISFLI